jgi:uncharacterized protein involved in propanediol utilization
MQGVLTSEPGNVLVTFPVARWTIATFTHDAAAEDVLVRPKSRTKAQRMARLTLRMLGLPTGGVLSLDSTLPTGKGMASSSADLVATARAVGAAVGRSLRPEQIENLAGAIEPTDGVMHVGIIAYDHRRAVVRGHLGTLPPLTIVGIDEGGEVDTVDFNSRDRSYCPADRWRYLALLEEMTRAVGCHDLSAVGQLASQSGLMNQSLCPKSTLDPVLEICREIGGLGVVVAHSGTMLGVLLDPGEAAYGWRLAETVQACATFGLPVSVHRTVSF